MLFNFFKVLKKEKYEYMCICFWFMLLFLYNIDRNLIEVWIFCGLCYFVEIIDFDSIVNIDYFYKFYYLLLIKFFNS